jgi:putative spermidine/putrescine transport system ATP-binding protein
LPHRHDGDSVLIIVRPEEVSLQSAEEGAEYITNGAGNRIAGVIELRTFLGPFTRFHVKIEGETTLTADVPSQQARGYETGQRVVLSFPPTACQVLPLEAEEAVKLAQVS